MTSVAWESEDSGEVACDEPIPLTDAQIAEIVDGLRFSFDHNPVQENLINIHREKTRRKLKTVQLRPSKFPELKNIILHHFYTSMISPGEAVGVNAAQCIGEPTTQLTLNSVAGWEQIIIQTETGIEPGIEAGVTSVVAIGEWIDGLLKSCPDQIQHIPENRTEYLELKNPVFTPSPSKDGKVTWEHITAVTRHLPVGDLVKITTRSGRSVTATQSKSLLVWNDALQEFSQVGGDAVKVGDLVPVIAEFPQAPIITDRIVFDGIQMTLDTRLGLMVGVSLAGKKLLHVQDPEFQIMFTSWCRDHLGQNFIQATNDKAVVGDWLANLERIPSVAWTSDLAFVKGILDGFCMVKGRVGDGSGSGRGNVIISTNAESGFAALCSRLNIFGIQTSNEFITSAKVWWEKVSSCSSRLYDMLQKASLVDSNIAFKQCRSVILDPITSVEKVTAPQYVYDLTVPATTNFTLWNGLGIADTFHSAGVSAKNVTLGFPRARELFNATQNLANPTCTIYFTKDNDTPQALHRHIDGIPEAKIDDLLKSYRVFEPDDYRLEYWHTAWFRVNPEFGELGADDWCLRLEFKVEELYEHNVTLKTIAKKLQEEYVDVRCIPSPLNMGILDIIVNCGEIAIKSNRTTELVTIQDDYQAQVFYMNKIASPKIRGLLICGIPGITKLYRRKAKPDDPFGGFPLKKDIADRIKTEEEWIVDTDGTNLAAVLALPAVDAQRTISNDVWEIYSLFGIEAARQYLFLEFGNIVSGGGISINPVHLQVLVDKMTYTGSIRAIARFGVETAQYDPIARATFEEVMSQIVTSAMFSEKDNLSGISSNIVLGTKINAGTGRVKFEDIPVRVVSGGNQGGNRDGEKRQKIRPPGELVTEDL